ncbi:hypothetical protein JW978_01990 [Candidatus Dojkabacteria bacterium]|nr:hypothetical protein [Candidatus Dojkabacteria bacterium]
MPKICNKLSVRKKLIVLVASLPIISFIGAIIGLFIGLVSTTFIPMCCDEGGCHNCLEVGGMVGYEAAGVIGFVVGVVLLPIIFVVLLLLIDRRAKKAL